MSKSEALWAELETQASKAKLLNIKKEFDENPNRFKQYSMQACGITLDYSKNLINEQSLNSLFALAESRQVEAHRDAMFKGEAINTTEQRAVLHTALRNKSGEAVKVDGQDIMPEVQQTLEKMKHFVNAIVDGSKVGYSGKKFTDVLSLGIGGSFLGPKIMSQALKPYQNTGVKVHFVANVDGCHIKDVLAGLNPETTLVITSSKTLTTQETLRNLTTARDWFLKTAAESDVQYNFACVSTNIKGANKLGITEENIFPMWDWVGGRYSVWSAIGLPLALAIGFEHFDEFLSGAYEMDCHFKSAPLNQNMPVIMALLGVWYRNFFNAQSHVLLPYYHYLRGLPAYVQQLDMESNGKRVTLSGREVDYETGPIIWGSEGTNGQHSFHQLIHQSSTIIPVDFMLPLIPHHDVADHHDMLASNCFGQSQALMEGQSLAKVKENLAAAGLSELQIDQLAIHKVMPGNKPSNTLVFNELSPKTLGSLIALYEHKVFVQGVIWQINSFDQWGVELGKVLGNQVLAKVKDASQALTMDSSTNALIEMYRNRK